MYTESFKYNIPFLGDKKLTVIKKIKVRGYWQQERQYLFPSLYGNKAVTRNTKGQFITFNRQLKRGKYAPSF